MKKLLSTIALATLASAALATTATVGVDYVAVANSPDNAHAAQTKLGLAQSTRFGTFDVKAVTGNTTDPSQYQSGWELGYAYPIAYPSFTLVPRVMVGFVDNGNIDSKTNGRYSGLSIEGLTPIAKDVGAFANVEVVAGTEFDITRTLKFGIDYSLTKQFGIRAGYVYRKVADTNANGVTLVGSYSF